MATPRLIRRVPPPPSRRRTRQAEAIEAAERRKAASMATPEGQQQALAGPGQAYSYWISREISEEDP